MLAQQLAILTGRSPDDTPAVPATLPEGLRAPLEIDLGALVASRPDVQAAEQRLAAAEARTLSSLLAFAPTVGLTAQAGQQAILIVEPRSQLVWGGGATLSVPLFAAGQRWASWRQASRLEEAERATLRQLRLRATQSATGALTQLQAFEAQLASARAQREAARLALESARER